MLEVADALAVVLRHAARPAPEAVALSPDDLGRVLAAGVVADRDSPPFDKSLRDGYAVRAADCVGGASDLRVVERLQAGAVPKESVGPGECARIFTGAPIPPGANSVVMQEYAQPLAPGLVRIADADVRPGQWVFARGREMRKGDAALPAGSELNPAAFGVIAGVGLTTVSLYPRPRVAVLATGDELVEAGSELGPGQIRNSNGPMLVAQATRAGARARSLGIGRDNRALLRELVAEGLADSRVLLLAGGVSTGDFDLVPGVLQKVGVETHFHKVRMKPGKPLLFGTKGNALVFGLPGNPVSAFVAFELFVRPALRAMAGQAEPGPTTLELPLAEPLAASNDRPTYHPAALELAPGGWKVRPLAWSGAPDLRGLRPADALLVLPSADARYDAGQLVSVVVLS